MLVTVTVRLAVLPAHIVLEPLIVAFGNGLTVIVAVEE
jgi:hypothetical protein